MDNNKARKNGIWYILGGAVCLFVGFVSPNPINSLFEIIGISAFGIGIYQLIRDKTKKRIKWFLGRRQNFESEIKCPRCGKKNL